MHSQREMCTVIWGMHSGLIMLVRKPFSLAMWTRNLAGPVRFCAVEAATPPELVKGILGSNSPEVETDVMLPPLATKRWPHPTSLPLLILAGLYCVTARPKKLPLGVNYASRVCRSRITFLLLPNRAPRMYDSHV